MGIDNDFDIVSRSRYLSEPESEGIELETSGQLTPYTLMRLSYTWLDSRTTKDAINPGWGVEIPAGSCLVNIPEHNVSLLLRHNLHIRSLPAHAGITVNYVGERIGDTVNPDYVLPEHWLIDLNAGVELMADLSLQASITNVTDTF